MNKAKPVDLDNAFASLTFMANRTPESTTADKQDAFARLSDYRNGGVFIGHYAGNSEWECHPHGDEIVMVVDGETTLVLYQQGQEVPHTLQSGQLIVVPKDVWHRFETPNGVKVMTVTPQPTIHSKAPQT